MMVRRQRKWRRLQGANREPEQRQEQQGQEQAQQEKSPALQEKKPAEQEQGTAQQDSGAQGQQGESGAQQKESGAQQDNAGSQGQETLPTSLDAAIDQLKAIFSKDETLKIRLLHNHGNADLRLAIVYIDGMIDNQLVNDAILRPVMRFPFPEEIKQTEVMHLIHNQVIPANNVLLNNRMDQVVDAIISGNTVLLLDGVGEALIISSQGFESRSISIPETEKNIRGPQESFTESLVVNLTMIRRKIKQPDLKICFKEIGTRTHTRISVCYLETLASEKILDELYRRLDSIDIDGILDTGYIQELITDEPYSPFDMIGSTERPDVVAGRLLEGRIAVLVDGTPSALTLPYLFVEAFQSSEDYYVHYMMASFNRIIRVLGAFISVSVPAVFTALLTYNQEMIPTPLLMSIASARLAVPFPTVFEAFMMLIVFEILREAGTRMPTPIGQTASIVGALVLGQAAVEARIVSAPMVIVVGITGVTALLNVKLKAPTIIVRFLFLGLAAVLGLYGYFIGILGLIVHLMGLHSFGVPYMLTVGSISPEIVKDTILRGPWYGMKLRPPVISGKNRRRQGNRKRG